MPTIITPNTSPQVSTVAQLANWMNPITEALSSFGWVQTKDAGQSVWSDLSAVPGSLSTSAYQIWGMNDALQSKFPVFIKLCPSAWNGSTSFLNLILIVGNATDGNGNMVGNTLQFNLWITEYNSAFPSYFSGDTNRFIYMLFYGNPNTSDGPLIFSIERQHTATGADADGYITIISGQIGPNPATFVGGAFGQVNMTATATLPSQLGGYTFQTTASTSTRNGTSSAVPFFPMVGCVDYPAYGLVTLKTANYPTASPFVLTIYGSDHTYMPLPSFNIYPGQAANNTTNCLAMRWE